MSSEGVVFRYPIAFVQNSSEIRTKLLKILFVRISDEQTLRMLRNAQVEHRTDKAAM